MNKEEVVTLIRSLLSSTKTSYSVNMLNKEFKRETGSDIPLFGYKNISDFLHSIPDTVKLSGIYPYQQVFLVANDKSAHILSLVERQKVNNRRKIPEILRIHPKKESIKLPKGGMPDRKITTCSADFSVRESLKKKQIYEKISNEEKPRVTLFSKNQFREKLYNYLKTCSNGATLKEIKNEMESNCNWSETLSQIKILNFVKSCPFFLVFNDKVYTVEIFKNLVNKNETVQDIQTVEVNISPKNQDETKSNNKALSTVQKSNSDKSPPLLSDFCLNDLLILKKEAGISYNRLHGCQGFNSSPENSTEGFDSKQLRKKLPAKPEQRQIPHKNSLSYFNNISDGSLFADDVLRFGEKIPKLDLKLYAKVGEYIEVFPCEVCNPHKFYLQLRKHRKELCRLMDDLQSFYRTALHRGSYEMPDTAMKVSQNCAALYEADAEGGKWHRAEIFEPVADSQVVVHLIDYGKTVKISKNNLRFLHRNFKSHPRQAFLASLANIKQTNGESRWSRRANERFGNLVLNKDLVAGVVDIDTKVPWMSVALSFTKGVEIHINDTLVKEGLARFEIEVEDEDLFGNESKIIRPKGNQLSHNFCLQNEKLSRRSNLDYLSSDSKNSTGVTYPHSSVFDFEKNARLKSLFSSVGKT